MKNFLFLSSAKPRILINFYDPISNPSPCRLGFAYSIPSFTKPILTIMSNHICKLLIKLASRFGCVEK